MGSVGTGAEPAAHLTERSNQTGNVSVEGGGPRAGQTGKRRYRRNHHRHRDAPVGEFAGRPDQYFGDRFGAARLARRDRDQRSWRGRSQPSGQLAIWRNAAQLLVARRRRRERICRQHGIADRRLCRRSQPDVPLHARPPAVRSRPGGSRSRSAGDSVRTQHDRRRGQHHHAATAAEEHQRLYFGRLRQSQPLQGRRRVRSDAGR